MSTFPNSLIIRTVHALCALGIMFYLLGPVVADSLGMDGESEKVAQARRLLTLRRPEEALQLLVGETPPVEVLRLEALVASRQITEAYNLMKRLESEDHGAFPSPFDAYFYTSRAILEHKMNHLELADKNFKEALRRARQPDDKIRILGSYRDFLRDTDNQEGAVRCVQEAGQLLSRTQNIWSVARVLEMQAPDHEDKSQLETRIALLRAAREIYLAHQNPIAAADILALNPERLCGVDPSEQPDFHPLGQLVQEYIASKAYRKASHALLANIYQLNDPGRRQQFLQLHQWALETLPAGEERDRARLVFEYYPQETEKQKALVRDEFLKLLDSSSEVLRAEGHLYFARKAKAVGDFESARNHYQGALELARPVRAGDREWSRSVARILNEVVEMEIAAHNYSEARRLTQLGPELIQGDDWRAARLALDSSRLQIALDTGDEETAVGIATERLRELASESDHRRRIGFSALYYTISGDMREMERRDPADLALPQYDGFGWRTLRKTLGSDQGMAEMLPVFDRRAQEARENRDSETEGFAQLDRARILELGRRWLETEILLQSVEERIDSLPIDRGCSFIRARLAYHQGRPAEAGELLEELVEKYPSDSESDGLYLLLAGEAYRRATQYQQSVDCYSRAIPMLRQTPWHGHFGRGLTFEKMSDLPSAEQDYRTALQEVPEKGFALPKATIQSALARTRAARGVPEEAEGLFAEALGSARAARTSEALVRVATDYLVFLEAQGRDEEALGIAMETADLLKQWGSVSVEGGHKLLERGLDLAARLPAQGQEMRLRQAFGFQTSRPERLDTESGRGLLLADTRADFFTELTKLKRTYPDFENTVPLSASQLEEMQSLLPAGTVFVEYFPAPSALYSILVTPESFHLYQLSIDRAQLFDLVNNLGTAASSPTRNDVDSYSSRLHGLLLSPFGAELREANQLLLAPTGPLWKVPFCALIDESGTTLNRYLTINLITSTQLLTALEPTREGRRRWPTAPLLVAGSQSLAGVKAEVETLSKLLPNSVVLPALEVTRKSFLEAARGKDLLHLASHSRVQRGEFFLELGSESLSLEEVYALQLQPGSLVILSSCESAVGENSQNRELTSFASAFGLAGASTVIASRWRVEDGVTASFFALFYEALLKGESRGQALRSAQLGIAEEYPHPYYWAAFSLLGDAR